MWIRTYIIEEFQFESWKWNVNKLVSLAFDCIFLAFSLFWFFVPNTTMIRLDKLNYVIYSVSHISGAWNNLILKMTVKKWICTGKSIYKSICVNTVKLGGWVWWALLVSSLKLCYFVCVSWISLSDAALAILMSWILQIKIASRDLGVLIWQILKSIPCWCNWVWGSFCLGSKTLLLCELTSSPCQTQPGGCSLPRELTNVPDEECMWQHVSY